MKHNVEILNTWLTPLRFSHSIKYPDGHSISIYWFRCRCGTEKEIRVQAVLAAGRGRKCATTSCGCWRKTFPRPWIKKYRFKKGNKIKRKNPRPKTGKPAWNTGKIKHEYPNGRVVWIKVSDKPLGPNHPWTKI